MGVYCFSPRALSHIEPGERLDFPDLILRLIAAGEEVRGWTVPRLLARHRSPRRLRAGPGGVRAHARSPHPAGVKLRDRDIVCVGFADWDTELWTNQHHLMSRLAARQPRAVRRVARPAPAAARGARPAADRPAAAARARAAAARVGRPARALAAGAAAAPQRGRARAQRAAAARARRGARRGGSAARGRSCGPTSRRPRRCSMRLQPSLVVYHCVDDIAAQTGVDGASFRAAEERFAAPRGPRAGQRPRAGASGMRSDLTTTCSYAPNVADTELVRARRSRRAPSTRRWTPCRAAHRLHRRDRGHQARPRPARRRSPGAPDWTFALVGPDRPGRPEHRRLRAAAPSRTSTCSAPRAYERAAGRPARRRRRAHPLRVATSSPRASSR